MTTSTERTEQWTTRRLLAWMTEFLSEKSVDSPRVVGEMLLSHVLDCDRMRLYMEVDRPASPAELSRLRELVKRAAAHEPAQYLIGKAWFFGREYAVNRSTLIPRPSTETLVERVIGWARGQNGPDDEPRSIRIADIGTGTGCIAVSLAADLPHASLLASDISGEAIELARTNAEHHGVLDRIEFQSGSLFEAIEAAGGGPLDVICSNPPYIPDHEWEQVAPNVKDYEPAPALRAGADGLNVIRPLIAGAGARLRPGGLLAIEIANCQKDAAIDLVNGASNLDEAEVVKDHEGLWRVLLARRVA